MKKMLLLVLLVLPHLSHAMTIDSLDKTYLNNVLERLREKQDFRALIESIRINPIQWTRKFPPPELVLFLEDNRRVTYEFAEKGSMYRVKGLIWGGLGMPAPSLNHVDAKAYCHSLGGTSRLPTDREYLDFAQSLGKDTEAGYNRRALKGLQRGWYWTAIDAHNDPTLAVSYNSDEGFLDFDLKDELNLVLCVAG